MSSWFESAGWSRLKKFYMADEPCMERDLTLRTLRTTFIVTGVLGGLAGRAETEKRLQMYTTGVTFGSPSNRFRRTMDFRILQFVKNGFRYGTRSSVLIGSILMTTTHLTLYRDRFSLWYPPTVAASACAFFSFPLGLLGLLQASVLGLTAGSTLSASLYLYSLYLDKTVDGAYRTMRSEYEAELEEKRQIERDTYRIMKSEQNIWSPHTARRMALERREGRAAGLNIDEDDEAEDAKKS
ncbi:hypothetical protein M3Y99_00783400 [Aphelenchoides fujianensis]|nr:hypothetical protein M3Y99_00783400 [Aphelenchoides fujianensis]